MKSLKDLYIEYSQDQYTQEELQDLYLNELLSQVESISDLEEFDYELGIKGGVQ